MLNFFLKGRRGSITVFVTYIMIPVVFFTTFMVDLARIKLGGNEAAMAADNYGEAILTDYDNLLKELYGLFALTQSKEGTEALDRLNAYVDTYKMTSLKPNENQISFSHLGGFADKSKYEGWMPFQSAEAKLTAKKVEGATLSSPKVFNTQIGDFMKFRVVQAVGDDADSLVEAMESVQNMAGNIAVAKKRNELGKKASEVLELAQTYYAKLEAIHQYWDYVNEVNQKYREGTGSMDWDILEFYPPYQAYEKAGPDEVEAALEHREEIENADEDEEVEPLSEEEEELCDIGDAYYDSSVYPMDAGLASRFENYRNPLKQLFDRTGDLRTDYDSGYAVHDGDGDTQSVINFENFESRVNELQKVAEKLSRKVDDLQKLKEEMNEALEAENVTDELREGVEEEMEQLDELFESGGSYSAYNYLELAYSLDSNVAQNVLYRQQAEAMYESMEKVADECVNQLLDSQSAYEPELDLSQWHSFTEDHSFQLLYEHLRKCFGEVTGDSNTAKDKEDEADDLLEDVDDKLKEEEDVETKRDIPASFGMGDADTSGSFDITDMIDSAGDSFASSGLSDTGNRLWTKVYLTIYDLNMFTSRVTNVKAPDDETEGDLQEESLTGYPYGENINYLYKTEIEYLVGGHNSSKENLNEARNKILAFRSAMNLVATYTVKEINDLINAAARAATSINPVLGFVVMGALRLAVAGVETYADWTLLKQRDSVCILKMDKKDLSLAALPGEFSESLNKLLGGSVDTSGKSTALKLNYEQYLTIMMVFLTNSETLTERSANLITLNVNTVKQKIGSSGNLDELTFKMEDTVTAVDVTCSIQMNFLVMPKGIAKAAAADSLYSALESFGDNTYQYTITRGY